MSTALRGRRAMCLVAMFLFSAACRIEDRLIFQPSRSVERTPGNVGLEFRELFFTTADAVQLHGWHIPHREARSTLVWFHGNAGNIGHRVENIRLLHDKAAVNIVIFDYRGYGRSEGRISEAGTYLDAEAALGWIRNELRVPPQRIVLFGRSLGAAIAAEMANRYRVQGLILESPFISISAMAREVMPWLPIGALLRTRFDTRAKVAGIKTPLLVLHGDRDDIVPIAHGKAVFAGGPEPKEFYTIAGAGHNDTYIVGADPYFRKLKDFIDRTVSGP